MAENYTINIMDKINEGIRHRYATDSIIKKAFDNHVCHQLSTSTLKLKKRHELYFNPNLLILKPDLTEKFKVSFAGNNKKSIYFNPVVREYVEKIVGFDPITPEGKAKIRSMLSDLSKKRLKIVIVGYGGAMINFLWNLYLLSFISSFNDPIFEHIVVYEKENISLTNILRISKPILLESFLDIHQKEGRLPKVRLLREEFQLADSITSYIRYLEDPEEIKILNDDGYIFIGAPNFEARMKLEETNFIFMGHANNELEIFFQPIVNNDLTFESYGSIDIPVLLSNLAAGTISMIDILGQFQTDKNEFAFEKGASLLKIDYGEINGIS